MGLEIAKPRVELGERLDLEEVGSLWADVEQSKRPQPDV